MTNCRPRQAMTTTTGRSAVFQSFFSGGFFGVTNVCQVIPDSGV